MFAFLNRLLISITVVGLAACAKTPVGPYADLKRPPQDADVKVELIDADTCKIAVQTTEKTCTAFIGDKDPEGVVCQSPEDPEKDSSSRNERMITWSVPQGFELTVQFEDGDPFKTTTGGKCKLEQPAGSFKCMLRHEHQEPPLKPDYKYGVTVHFVEDDTAMECARDPRVYLMR